MNEWIDGWMDGWMDSINIVSFRSKSLTVCIGMSTSE